MRNKILLVILMVMLALSAIPLSASAATTGGQIELYWENKAAGKSPADPIVVGDEFDLVVKGSYITHLYSYGVNFFYDSAAIEPKSGAAPFDTSAGRAIFPNVTYPVVDGQQLAPMNEVRTFPTDIVQYGNLAGRTAAIYLEYPFEGIVTGVNVTDGVLARATFVAKQAVTIPAVISNRLQDVGTTPAGATAPVNVVVQMADDSDPNVTPNDEIVYTVNYASALTISTNPPPPPPPPTGNGVFADGKIKVEGKRVGSKVELKFSYQNLHAGLTGLQIDIPVPQNLGLSNPVFTKDAVSGLQDGDIQVNQIVGGVYRLQVPGDRLVTAPLGTTGVIGKVTFDSTAPSTEDVQMNLGLILLNVHDGEQPELKVENVSMTVPKTPSSIVIPAGHYVYDVNRDGQVNNTDLTVFLYYMKNTFNYQNTKPPIPLNKDAREVLVSDIADNKYFYDINLDGQINNTDLTVFLYYMKNTFNYQNTKPNFAGFVKQQQ